MPYVDATAPAVIDEDLCRACIHLLQPKEQGVESESYRHTTANKAATLPFGEVESLMFSFKNILKINNLVGFDRLVKLYLDNNVIVKIENLDHLVNLEWLDLSFNNIEHISGLDKLTNLANLSLFENKIETIDNMDALVGSLQVFSIGKNRISELDQVKVLRKFPHLQAVTFAGNKMCENADYRAYVLSHLRHLRFLDYRLVDEAEVAQAESDGALQEKLQEIRLAEQQEEEEREAQRKLTDRTALLTNAHMAVLDNFWAKMDTATEEFTSKVAVVEQLADLHTKHKAKFESKMEEFIQTNLSAVQVKAKELQEFKEAAHAMKLENNAEAITHIAEFNARAKKVQKLFTSNTRYAPQQDQEKDEALVELRAANETLFDQLMQLEILQVDQFIAAIDAFEANYSSMHNTTLEAISGTFNGARTLAAAWVEEAHELANERHEDFVTHNLNDSEDVADDLKAVLNDKEGMTTAIDSAQEARITFLDSTEDALAKAEKAAFNGVMDELRKGEHSRNRERIHEISNLVHNINKEMMDKLDSSMDADDN